MFGLGKKSELAQAAATPAPGASANAPAGGSGAPGGNGGQDLHRLTGDLVGKHTGNGSSAGRAAGRFSSGGTPWNKGRRVAMAPAAGPAPAPDPNGGDPCGVQPIDPSAVREMVALGFQALDETLRQNFQDSWFKLTGDRGFAVQQSEFYGAKPGQVKAVALFAGMCADKYQAQCQYLPEIGLLVAVGAYGVNWRIGFNKLNQAAALKAAADRKAKDATHAPADKAADHRP
jgi:hypothetical protein